jgi:hypothetical protein
MAQHRPQNTGYSLPPMFHSHLPGWTREFDTAATNMKTAVKAAAGRVRIPKIRQMATIHSTTMAP